ncbi:MAG: Chorismate synthase [Candidatus Jettenia ecosi]|uniref:chorismate synthase n=1 Tax=Candidatus Jettenia ecosi TaxID=2494326 RepID=A0A533QLH4_9BACT|nr:MAG: Chorismate synthase [Candidatus Jettenia ecosi]
MLYFKTAGESHGKCLITIIEGFPAGVLIDEALLNKEMKRRQGGLGRGGRMQIEEDRVEILSGIRNNRSLGSPICLMVKNSDYKIDELPAVTKPRPGHADLAGVIKYNQKDARDILERASARETAARVAAGAVIKILLSQFGIEVFGYVKGIGGINSDKILKDLDIGKKIVKRVNYIALIRILKQGLLKRLNKHQKKGILWGVLLK